MAYQSYEDFLKTYTTDVTSWANDATGSDISEPDDDKIAQGWVIEKPKHSYFNWWQNRTDSRIAELEAQVSWLVQELVKAHAE